MGMLRWRRAAYELVRLSRAPDVLSIRRYADSVHATGSASFSSGGRHAKDATWDDSVATCYTGRMKLFLLGAGASVDAGLQSSVGLTRAIADRLGRGSYRNPIGQLLHAVIGAMVQHDAGAGGDAFLAPDVERVFSAVTSLKSRETLDISAFVERWNGSLDAATAPAGLPESWANGFRESLSGERAGDRELHDMFELGVAALTQSQSWPMFAELEHQMLRALVDSLKVDPEEVSYLRPMVESSDLRGIATLNYDTAVEQVCARTGLSVDTGLDRWTGGYGWAWEPDVDVRLLKLHGSLDYVLHHARPTRGAMSSEHLVPVQREVGAKPALVFGLGSKLRSDGPFLAMLVELDRLLAETEWLSIVGYSFRDTHINAALTRWMNSNTAKRLTVIDPDVDKWLQKDAGSPDYFKRLAQGASGKGWEFGRTVTWAPLKTDFIAKGAAQGLAEVHG